MSLFPSFIAGLVLGLWHFGSLQWFCHRLIVNSQNSQIKLVAWYVLRIVVMSAVLGVLAFEGDEFLVMSVAGILLSRTVLISAVSPLRIREQ